MSNALQIATPSRKKTLEKKFIKGALTQAKCATQMQRQLAENTAAERERKARSGRSRRQLQRGGFLYASQAREMTKQREKEGGTQLQRSLRREAQLRFDLEEAERKRKNQANRLVDLLCDG
jgi:hypothetical protein